MLLNLMKTSSFTLPQRDIEFTDTIETVMKLTNIITKFLPFCELVHYGAFKWQANECCSQKLHFESQQSALERHVHECILRPKLFPMSHAIQILRLDYSISAEPKPSRVLAKRDVNGIQTCEV